MTTLQLSLVIITWAIILTEAIILIILSKSVLVLFRLKSKKESPLDGLISVGEKINVESLYIDFDSGPHGIKDLVSEGSAVVVFGSTSCPICVEVVNNEMIGDYLSRNRITGVFIVDSGIGREAIRKTGNNIFVIASTPKSTFDEFNISAVPYVYLLNDDRIVIAKGLISETSDFFDIMKTNRHNTINSKIQQT